MTARRTGAPPRRSPRAPAVVSSPPRCTYRACLTPPVKRIQQSIGGRPWFGCPAHYPAMVDAFQVGLPGATSGGAWVDVTDVPAIEAAGAVA